MIRALQGMYGPKYLLKLIFETRKSCLNQATANKSGWRWPALESSLVPPWFSATSVKMVERVVTMTSCLGWSRLTLTRWSVTHKVRSISNGSSKFSSSLERPTRSEEHPRLKRTRPCAAKQARLETLRIMVTSFSRIRRTTWFSFKRPWKKSWMPWTSRSKIFRCACNSWCRPLMDNILCKPPWWEPT